MFRCPVLLSLAVSYVAICSEIFFNRVRGLFPIVVAAHVWGSSWFRQVALFHSDNESVVHVLNSRTSKAPDIMHLLCSLLVAATKHNFRFVCRHTADTDNKVADALSRFQWQTFRRLAPQADTHPMAIPPKVWHFLTHLA